MAVEFKITDKRNDVHYRYNLDSVQDLIEEMTEDMGEAFTVSSWCEGALIGETYSSSDYDFTVEIREI